MGDFDYMAGHMDMLSFDLPNAYADFSAYANRTLFLGDLSYFCTEEDLCGLFRTHGPIMTVRVRRGGSGDSLMHGFVALDSPDMARRAIKDLDGAEFMGRNIRCVMELYMCICVYGYVSVVVRMGMCGYGYV